VLSDQDIGLGRRETVEDVARVLDRYCDGIVARLFAHRDLVDLAAASVRPVINALTDGSHPCQILADLLTMREALGRLDATTPVAFVGDGNNVARSLVEAAALLRFPLTVVTPPSYGPDLDPAYAGAVRVTSDLAAVEGAAVVYTDVWTSMGQEAERAQRLRAFEGWTIDAPLMKAAGEDAIFMHCLPAHRGEEVSAEVIDGPQSVVWQQAGNRMDSVRALIVDLVSEGS
jgi:ornithine carbamoyltransferase